MFWYFVIILENISDEEFIIKNNSGNSGNSNSNSGNQQSQQQVYLDTDSLNKGSEREGGAQGQPTQP